MKPSVSTTLEKLTSLEQSISDLQEMLSTSEAKAAFPQGVMVSGALIESIKEISYVVNIHHRNYDRLNRMAETSRLLNTSLETKVVLQNVMDAIIEITGAERGFLMRRDRSGQFVTQIARNWEQDSLAEEDIQVSRTIIQRVMDTCQPVLTTNAREDPRFQNQESVLVYKLRSVLCVPLLIKDDLVGVIYTDHRVTDRVFSDMDRETLMAFSNQAAIALENARLYSSIQRSLSDVTALKNLMISVFSSLTSGVITTDEARNVIFCNPSARKMLQIQPGMQLLPAIIDSNPDFARQIEPHLALVESSETPLTGIELKPVSAGKGTMDFRLSLAPLRDPKEKKMRGMTMVLEDLTETNQLKAHQRMFEKMVSPAVIRQLDKNALHLGGSRATLSVLFADISGFTNLGENVSPEVLLSVVNCYLSAAAEIILDEGGTIDKFLGDSVMAWFNAPLQQPDHALRALRTAWRIREILPQIYSQLETDFHLDFSMGIHTGEAIIGMIGSEKRMEFTAIGDTVNIAKRLQESAQASQIILTAQTAAEVRPHVMLRRLDPLLVRGRRETLEVFELLGIN